jgi:uncharacterized protein YtpQ (UPF0354 family)
MTTEYTFLSSTHEPILINNILFHKSTRFVFDRDKMKLEINNRRKFWKLTNMLKLNSIILKNLWVKEEIVREIRKFFEINKNENTKTYGYSLI